MPETYEWKDLLDPSGVVIEATDPTGRGTYAPPIQSILQFFAGVKKAAELAGKVKNPFVKVFTNHVKELMSAADAIVKAGKSISEKTPGGLVQLTVVIPRVKRRVTIERKGDSFEVLEEKEISRNELRKSQELVHISKIDQYLQVMHKLESNLQEYIATPWKCPPGKAIVEKETEEEESEEDTEQAAEEEAREIMLAEYERHLTELQQDVTELEAKLKELNQTFKELNAKKPDEKKIIAEYDRDVEKAQKTLKSLSATRDSYERMLKKAKDANADSKDIDILTAHLKKSTERETKGEQDLKDAKDRRKAKFTPQELVQARKDVQQAIKDTEAALKAVEVEIRATQNQMK